MCLKVLDFWDFEGIITLMNLEITDKNYSAEIVRLKKPRKHAGADRLLCWSVGGNNVITDLSTQEGDLMVFFPVECQISEEFLSNNSLYREATLNKSEKTGFYERNGRTRCVKLRGEPSEGFVIPLKSLDYIGELNLKEGDVFNKIGDHLICRKYVPKNSGGANKTQKAATKNNFLEGQFAFHDDTENFGRNLRNFNLDDVISISYKLHGTSFTVRKILHKRKFLWFSLPPVYKTVASSRRVVHDIKSDKIWTKAARTCEDALQNGLAFYGEVVGYDEGKIIQKDFDYGCDPGEFEVYIYRITYTTPEGRVIEYSPAQTVEFCNKFDLKTPPVFFNGTVKDFLKSRNIPESDDWRDLWLTQLKQEFNEKDCFICQNKVPEEGVVIRKDTLKFEAYKLKSSRFLEKETQMLDKGEAVES